MKDTKNGHRSLWFKGALLCLGVSAISLAGAVTAEAPPAAPAQSAGAAAPAGKPAGEPLANGIPYSEVVRYSLAKEQVPTAAPTSVPRIDGHPDFSGMWLQDQGILFSDPTPKHHSGSHPGYDDSLNPPPFNDEYAARYKAFKERVAKEGYNRQYDCDPPGMPRLMANPFPMELIQTKDKLVTLHEYKSQMRRIYLDGRAMPSEDDYTPSFNGVSIGKWDGETLVSETGLIDVPAGKLIQITGIEHSDKLKIIERVRFLTKDRIEWEITMVDPVVFTKPWVNRRSFSRKPLTTTVPEYECLAGELIKELGYTKAAAPAPAK
ncbi:hypothetical protein [Sphingobium subterraneum]|uniref:DUF3108 domain-containing protein n=1 Tax=Sphingobium subterraneum TaxID=627688 RepID=A0A841J5C4_9SPHN|nr:hypothetical protein [Sphingobium subterraneum]MBB6123421.1 hypothetical protein [Sphingobium subterraneum]